MTPDMTDGLHYLASPYSHYQGGAQKAFEDVSRLAGMLLERGVHCFSPIAHSHPIAVYAGLPAFDHTLWLEHDERHMARCDALLIAGFPGWAESYGVRYENDVFFKAGKPIRLVVPETLEIILQPQEVPFQ